MSYEVTVVITYKGITETPDQLEKFTKEIERQATKAGLTKTALTTETKEETIHEGRDRKEAGN